MKRKTLTQQLEETNRRWSIDRLVIKQLEQQIEQLKFRCDFYRINERRYDQLLEGMCMGMREAVLPRRPYG